jgi:hypothetical protein
MSWLTRMNLVHREFGARSVAGGAGLAERRRHDVRVRRGGFRVMAAEAGGREVK